MTKPAAVKNLTLVRPAIAIIADIAKGSIISKAIAKPSAILNCNGIFGINMCYTQEYQIPQQ
jgi:hypothetical protein